MNERKLTAAHISAFRRYLCREEKSAATIEKYLRDVRTFARFAGKEPVTKDCVMAYKHWLQSRGYAPRSINSMLASISSLLNYLGWSDCRVRSIKLQKQVYCAEKKELTRHEYRRLLAAADKDLQLRLVMQTICATGIRVSELSFFTLESIAGGEVVVSCKGKTRTILIPGKLRSLLLAYAAQRGITSGAIFLTRSGKPLDRRSIWARMKALCRAAGVEPSKVFPHNLRKLFARTFYDVDKDIAKLADILGHSSIDTTRIYVMTTAAEHRRKMERLGLV